MLELGSASKKQHEKLGKKCNSSNLDAIFTLGVETLSTKNTIKNKKTNDHFENHNHLISTLKSFLISDDKVLFKGSRECKWKKLFLEFLKTNAFRLLLQFKNEISFFNLFEYLTFKTAISAITALIISFIIGPITIKNSNNIK